ncbi:sensor histidine kinase [Clostridium estertheticum]|uniref:histidine kinase n=1 Tax=Clostridium estertheticum subsp. estertheticum TaxID=1552 RepID=A0A1J0GGI6_9CLOT|nr:sensor histidine kinase [Clostridium estertheticum]APC40088.1 two-component sensor histidine kinase [Clostridium estertheticum subsp. estertheticum]MBU3072405.1 sensor histidine kinase [Clostridium estertheticum]MBU3162498.1 sensor histidine kinase [Clostridium estertheticum]MBU3170301.1 sensor histidine kinase [Clostridium estertheticum]MBZ9618135.1 sensor histidine kinase [Clostridium estertheticum subsp. laramiense]
MITLLIIIIFILICIILFKTNVEKKRNNTLKYIQNKLNKIINENTNEKLLVETEDKELKKILVEINNLLDFNQKILADYRKKEISISKMLSNISHDLKTPLTVVLGYIETIKLDNNISKDERDLLLSNVYTKALEVIDLINEFFDLAKLESGDKDITISRVNINEICRKSILEFYENLTSKGYEVSIDIPSTNIYVLGNLDAIHRIMNNLISNAIKYGSDGKYLGLKLTYDDNCSYVEICDKGKGIEEINVDRVFERMYTLEDSRNKLYQGSGLGLTITKRLVEKLGGKISLESKPYEKTSFIFQLKRITY